MQKKLDEIAIVKVGYQARRAVQEASDGTHYLIESKDFDSFHSLKIDNLKRFFPERNPELYKVDIGDILLQAKGSEHYAYYLSMPLEKTLAAGSFYIIRIKDENIKPEFLTWWINQYSCQQFLKSQTFGASTPFIRKNTLLDLLIEIPSLEIQLKILSIIELWQKEQYLLSKIISEKSNLIAGLCIDLINKKGVR